MVRRIPDQKTFPGEYEQGRKAALRGEGPQTCIIKPSLRRDAWMNGWREGALQAQLEREP